jgi:hypothetical protein
MSIRLNCETCRTAFVTSDDQVGRRVTCPKCGAEQVAPSTAVFVPSATASTSAPVAGPASAKAPDPSVFVPAEAPRRPGRLRKIGLGAIVVVLIAAVGVAVSWPALRRWWHPIPPDPIEVAAGAYLQALADGDAEAAHRLGTVDEPPAIRSFRDVHRLPDRDRTIKGSFAPIAALHARINESFEYDPAIGRFKVRDPLGPAAETLDALHEAKAKAEQDAIYKKMASGDPNDIFDAAEGLGGTLAKMAEGVLAPRKLVPTYKQLVLDSKPPLPPAEAELALDYAAHREAWDALLKRPFPSLKADGPFFFQRAEVTATARDRLASLGDPPTTLHLTLVRFRLEGIDTGWKVISARRPSALPEPPAGPEPASTATESERPATREYEKSSGK